MNQNNGAARAFDHKVQARVVNGDEFRKRLRMIMSNAGSDVSLLESAGDAHKVEEKSEISGQRSGFFSALRRVMFIAPTAFDLHSSFRSDIFRS